MDLTTTYLGLTLKSPIVAGASPLTDDLDTCRALAAHGAGAVVMPSLFEEQIEAEEHALDKASHHDHAHPEAAGYLPELHSFKLAPDAYVEKLAELKKALDIPVVASLNGTSLGGWVHYAKRLDQAGADAIELNIYYLANDPAEDPRAVENRYVDVLRAVKAEVSVPVAVKLSPFFSAPVYMAKQLADAGADGLVLFNRFYQPDIDTDELAVSSVVELSTSSALLLRLRWLAATFGHVGCTLVATGGVHSGQDAIKAMMAGACAVQMASAVLRDGPAALERVNGELAAWMAEHEYESVTQMVGSMSLQRCPEPVAFERANYMKVLQSWR